MSILHYCAYYTWLTHARYYNFCLTLKYSIINTTLGYCSFYFFCIDNSHHLYNDRMERRQGLNNNVLLLYFVLWFSVYHVQTVFPLSGTPMQTTTWRKYFYCKQVNCMVKLIALSSEWRNELNDHSLQIVKM